MKTLLPVLLYGAFCIGFAKWNAWRIKRNRRIYHGINGALHLSLAILCGWLIHLRMAFIILAEARLLFDTALNRFRDEPLGYVPLQPKSIVDRLERAAFEPLFYFIRKRFKAGSYSFVVGILPKLFYAVLLIVLLLIQFNLVL